MPLIRDGNRSNPCFISSQNQDKHFVYSFIFQILAKVLQKGLPSKPYLMNRTSKLFSFIVLHLLILSSNAETVPEGNVKGIWSKPNSPYLIQGDLTIQSGDSLIIESGVNLIFQGHFKIQLESGGSLIALGTEGDSILFTVADTNGFSDRGVTNGGWNGINAPSAKDLVFSHCVFEFIKQFDVNAPLNFRSDDLMLTNSVIRNNFGQSSGGVHVYLVRNKALIRNNLFISDYNAGALWIQHNFDLLVEGNRFIRNTGGINGPGAIAADNCGLQVVIKNNFISQNKTRGYGGGISIYNLSGPQIVQNISNKWLVLIRKLNRYPIDR